MPGLLQGYAVVGLCAGCVHAMVPGLISSLFPNRRPPERLRAGRIAIGTALFTGLTPLFLAWLARGYGLDAPMYQYLGACAVALIVAGAVNALPKFLGTAEAAVKAGERLGEHV